METYKNILKQLWRIKNSEHKNLSRLKKLITIATEQEINKLCIYYKDEEFIVNELINIKNCYTVIPQYIEFNYHLNGINYDHAPFKEYINKIDVAMNAFERKNYDLAIHILTGKKPIRPINVTTIANLFIKYGVPLNVDNNYNCAIFQSETYKIEPSKFSSNFESINEWNMDLRDIDHLIKIFNVRNKSRGNFMLISIVNNNINLFKILFNHGYIIQKSELVAICYNEEMFDLLKSSDLVKHNPEFFITLAIDKKLNHIIKYMTQQYKDDDIIFSNIFDKHCKNERFIMNATDMNINNLFEKS